jgi:hypothetical protein
MRSAPSTRVTKDLGEILQLLRAAYDVEAVEGIRTNVTQGCRGHDKRSCDRLRVWLIVSSDPCVPLSREYGV